MKQKYYWDYCKLCEEVAKFVNDASNTKVICCQCRYAKPISQKKEHPTPKMKSKITKRNLNLEYR